jgi:hypothetical protein
MGLLDTIYGNPEQTQALGLLGLGLMSGNRPVDGIRNGLGMAMQYMGSAQERQAAQQLQQLKMQEIQSEIEQRQLKAQQDRAALERAQRIQQGLPGLFRQPGLSGGAPAPQTEGGLPMFSRPMGAAPMQATPGGFDVQGAIRLGLNPDDIQKYAGLENIGRPKATRQMEVDDGRGGKRIALVDDFGREVAGFAGYTPPVQVNQGDRVSFVRPEAGASLPVNMSPEARASNALGWANNALTRRGQDLTDARARETVGAGRVPPGYRFKPDGSLEAIPGGPADIKAGELGQKAEARQQGSLAQADSVLKEVRDAKGMVGWNTAGAGGALAALPATEARDLSAKLLTVKANLGFDRLQQMRDQSPTGGALGSVAQQELAALQSTVASLDQMQSPKQLGQALDKIEKHYTNWRNVVQQASAPKGGASGGWSIREKR